MWAVSIIFIIPCIFICEMFSFKFGYNIFIQINPSKPSNAVAFFYIWEISVIFLGIGYNMREIIRIDICNY